MANLSAGVLLYRRPSPSTVEVLLIHPGGPIWLKKDAGAWSIPKGNLHPGEAEVDGARREFAEETNGSASGRAVELGRFRQPSGKVVVAFAVEGDFDLKNFRSNTFEMEWPPRSKRMKEFPEADRAEWFSPDVAAEKLLPGQAPMIPALLKLLSG